jgi:hypothetical protein
MPQRAPWLAGCLLAAIKWPVGELHSATTPAWPSGLASGPAAAPSASWAAKPPAPTPCAGLGRRAAAELLRAQGLALAVATHRVAATAQRRRRRAQRRPGSRRARPPSRRRGSAVQHGSAALPHTPRTLRAPVQLICWVRAPRHAPSGLEMRQELEPTLHWCGLRRRRCRKVHTTPQGWAAGNGSEQRRCPSCPQAICVDLCWRALARAPVLCCCLVLQLNRVPQHAGRHPRPLPRRLRPSIMTRHAKAASIHCGRGRPAGGPRTASHARGGAAIRLHA